MSDEKVGKAANDLYNDALNMLEVMINKNLVKPAAAIGFWPANSDLDDIIIYENDSRKKILDKFYNLRQQVSRKNSKRANFCLSDFIAPSNLKIKDYIGGFLVTAGPEIEKISSEFEGNKDDYNSILVKSLGDRIAEALAEMMHQRVRTDFWGYDKNEKLNNNQLINEDYIGIRPAPGYPACPDHTQKETLFKLLDINNNLKVKLTESFAMSPSSSVSGLYFSNPKASYFGVGKINKDQVIDYASRRGISIEEAEKWLAPNLSYSPKEGSITLFEHNEKIKLPDLDFLSTLNTQQKNAVLNTEGPLLVLSGAGTGKTKVLTTRLANIIYTRKGSIKNILCVTFTNKAAFEMKMRVEKNSSNSC